MNTQWRRLAGLLLALPLIALLTTACGESPRPYDVEGYVHYSETVPLPDNAMLTVELVDISDMEHVSVVKDQKIPLPKDIPATFSIQVPAEKVKQDHLYGIQARITGDEEVLMATTDTYPVLTKGYPDSVSVELYPLEDALDREHTGLLEVQQDLLVFRPCGSDRSYLVNADPLVYEQMDQSYDNILSDDPAGVFLKADAHLEKNMGPEGLGQYDSTVVVSRIIELRGREPGDCPD